MCHSSLTAADWKVREVDRTADSADNAAHRSNEDLAAAAADRAHKVDQRSSQDLTARVIERTANLEAVSFKKLNNDLA